jgi:hypothetical protein
MATCDPRDIDPSYNLHVTSPNIVVAEGGPYTIRMQNEYENSVTFHSAGEEMLRCGPDGFFVRGKHVEQDDNEARIVYNAFKEWLTWQQLSR